MTVYDMKWFCLSQQNKKPAAKTAAGFQSLFQENKVKNKYNKQPVHDRMYLFGFPFAHHCNRVENKSDRNSSRNAVR